MAPDGSELVPTDHLWKRKSLSSEELLEFYNIHIDRTLGLDHDLSTLTETVKKSRGGDTTPTSHRIAERWKISSTLSEKNAQAALENVLGYRGEYEDLETGVKIEMGIIRSRDQLWKKDCLPIPGADQGLEFETIFKKAGLPSVPKPDITYGFTHAVIGEEFYSILKMLPDCANPLGGQPYFPYWIIEWKSSHNAGTIEEAVTQARRDGAAAVYTMYNFFRICNVNNLPPAATAVFTTCIDSNQVLTRVHWRRVDPLSGKVTYEADLVDGGSIWKAGNMFEFRSLVFNVLEWARNTRLPAIKQALESGGQRILNQVQIPSPKKKAGSPTKKQKTYVSSCYSQSAVCKPLYLLF